MVYGDIGTSPIYAFKQCFNGKLSIVVTVPNVLSLTIWSLILVISIKSRWFILNADNGGKGGIIALVTLFEPMDCSIWRSA